MSINSKQIIKEVSKVNDILTELAGKGLPNCLLDAINEGAEQYVRWIISSGGDDLTLDPIPEAVHKTLCLSTGHITELDDAKLQALGKQGLLDDLDYGYLIYVSPDYRDTELTGLSKAFLNIYDDALRHDYNYIIFDRDADIYSKTYPVFDW